MEHVHMQINRLSLIAGAKEARGLTVIIDVYRACTCAAYAMARSAQDIVLVGEAKDAFELKKKFPEAILMGEHFGKHIDGFDFDNSPTHVAESPRDFTRKRFIQRTSAGTQGVVHAKHADEIVLGNFVCANAIADYIRRQNPTVVSIVGMGDAGVSKTDEDEAFSEWLAASLQNGASVEAAPYLDKARKAQAVKHFEKNTPEAPSADVDYCLRFDAFDFVLTVHQEDGMLVARKNVWL
jgi:2-phosphosulfolactate phosphatase